MYGWQFYVVRYTMPLQAAHFLGLWLALAMRERRPWQARCATVAFLVMALVKSVVPLLAEAMSRSDRATQEAAAVVLLIVAWFASLLLDVGLFGGGYQQRVQGPAFGLRPGPARFLLAFGYLGMVVLVGQAVVGGLVLLGPAAGRVDLGPHPGVGLLDTCLEFLLVAVGLLWSIKARCRAPWAARWGIAAGLMSGAARGLLAWKGTDWQNLVVVARDAWAMTFWRVVIPLQLLQCGALAMLLYGLCGGPNRLWLPGPGYGFRATWARRLWTILGLLVALLALGLAGFAGFLLWSIRQPPPAS